MEGHDPGAEEGMVPLSARQRLKAKDLLSELYCYAVLLLLVVLYGAIRLGRRLR